MIRRSTLSSCLCEPSVSAVPGCEVALRVSPARAAQMGAASNGRPTTKRQASDKQHCVGEAHLARAALCVLPLVPTQAQRCRAAMRTSLLEGWTWMLGL